MVIFVFYDIHLQKTPSLSALHYKIFMLAQETHMLA